jgi:fatty acid desaturase
MKAISNLSLPASGMPPLPSSLLRQEPPLKDYTETVRQNVGISWYRTKLPPATVKALHEKSDFAGGLQTFGHLALIVGLGGAAWHSWNHEPWWATAGLLFLYAMTTSFAINAVHELGHGTVFRTRALNALFCHVFAFLGWINHEVFQSSHIRHHRYTLHPPDDLEVVLPVQLVFWHVLKKGIFYPYRAWFAFRETVRFARGDFRGEWELTLYPASDPAGRRAPVRWARIILLGNLGVVAVAAFTGQWILPLLSWGHLALGSWLLFLCNNTQHVGLQDNVSDFRLCCRTFTLNPVARFLYWQMNYHIEHHMYAAVPCYRLGRLHRLIRHDLPPTPAGLVGVWRQINSILREQTRNPGYQYQPVLPVPSDRTPAVA